MTSRRPAAIELWNGDHLRLLYVVYDPEEGSTAKKNLTSATVDWEIVRDRDETPALTGNGSVVSPGTAGKLRISQANVTIEPGQYFLRVHVTDAAGIRKTVAEDVITMYS